MSSQTINYLTSGLFVKRRAITVALRFLSFKATLVALVIIGSTLFLAVVTGCEDATTKPADHYFKAAGVFEVKPGQAADFTLVDIRGRRVSLSDHRGKIIFLNFWTTWCPSCKVEMPDMEKLHRRFKDREFVMLAVDLKEPAKVVREFSKRQKLTFTVLLDPRGQVGAQFRIRNIPTTLILDREGRVIGEAVGPRDWAGKASTALFEHLVSGGPG